MAPKSVTTSFKFPGASSPLPSDIFINILYDTQKYKKIDCYLQKVLPLFPYQLTIWTVCVSVLLLIPCKNPQVCGLHCPVLPPTSLMESCHSIHSALLSLLSCHKNFDANDSVFSCRYGRN